MTKSKIWLHNILLCIINIYTGLSREDIPIIRRGGFAAGQKPVFCSFPDKLKKLLKIMESMKIKC